MSQLRDAKARMKRLFKIWINMAQGVEPKTDKPDANKVYLAYQAFNEARIEWETLKLEKKKS